MVRLACSSQKIYGFYPNKDSLLSISGVFGLNGLRQQVMAGWSWCQEEINGRKARPWQGTAGQAPLATGCLSSWRVKTKVRRLECSFLQQGCIRFGWTAGIGRLLAVCFDNSRENCWRYSNTRLESSFPEQGWVRSSYVRGSTLSCRITNEVFQWQALTIESGASTRTKGYRGLQ